ncbi:MULTISPECIES: phage shock envelope stress response protein PspM [unclassified Frankia]|uniref:phage shock envelope stress response protein PspM n=1 Tax=unclassified Frankia TaxID=2632575 RepID=UPI002AD34369|nr:MULTISPECIES: hypothetical protein [unclassified Frankia]
MLVNYLPEWLRADVERRSLVRGERRLVRGHARRRRRAERSTRLWIGVAVLAPAIAAVEGSWGWLVVAAGALARAGLAWHQAQGAASLSPVVLPLPSAPLPSRVRLYGSAAADPLQRGEAAIAALAAIMRASPPGPAAEAVRAAMASAAEVVDSLRNRAQHVLACESAARAVADASRRAEIISTVSDLVSAMNAAVQALDAMLAAATDLLASTVSTVSTPLTPGQLDGLDRQTATLRAFAEGLRDLRR